MSAKVRAATQNNERARGRLILSVAAVGAVVVGVWPVFLAAAGPQPFMLMSVVAHVAGMLAGYGVLVLVALMSRWPALERGLGSDKIARWHAKTGPIVLSLVLIHACAATKAWADSLHISIGQALRDVLGMPYLIAATLGTVFLVAIAVVSARVARRHLSYEWWYGIHLIAYVAIALTFLHQLAGPDLTGHPFIQVVWALLYTHTFGLVLRFRIWAPLRAANRHRLRVIDVVSEAPGVSSVIIEGRHLDELQAESGHFFRWRFLTPDTWLTAHPFSLSAPPTADRLRLTIKALGDGSRLLQSVDIGTWVIAEGPYGAMTAARRTTRDVLLIAGGVGITPLRALFETMPLNQGQDMMLLYRARNREQLVFRTELDTLAAQRRAKVVYLLGEEPNLLSAESLQRLVPRIAERDVFMCASPTMSDTIRTALRRMGLPEAQLHEERFTFHRLRPRRGRRRAPERLPGPHRSDAGTTRGEQMGEDCAGALQFVAPDQVDQVLSRPASLREVSPSQVAEHLASLRKCETSWTVPGRGGDWRAAQRTFIRDRARARQVK